MAKFYDETVYLPVDELLGNETFIIYQSGESRTTSLDNVVSFLVDPYMSNFRIEDLNNVEITGIQNYDVLIYNGGNWVNTVNTLSILSDTTISSLDDDQILVYSGDSWVNTTLTLEGISDVVITDAQNNELLVYSAGDWVNTSINDIVDVTIYDLNVSFTGDGDSPSSEYPVGTSLLYPLIGSDWPSVEGSVFTYKEGDLARGSYQNFISPNGFNHTRVWDIQENNPNDDFEDGVLDTDLWDTSGVAGVSTVVESGGTLNITFNVGDGGVSYVEQDMKIEMSLFEYRFRMKIHGNPSDNLYQGFDIYNSNGNHIYKLAAYDSDSSNNARTYYTSTNGSYLSADTSYDYFSDNTIHYYRIRRPKLTIIYPVQYGVIINGSSLTHNGQNWYPIDTSRAYPAVVVFDSTGTMPEIDGVPVEEDDIFYFRYGSATVATVHTNTLEAISGANPITFSDNGTSVNIYAVTGVEVSISNDGLIWRNAIDNINKKYGYDPYGGLTFRFGKEYGVVTSPTYTTLYEVEVILGKYELFDGSTYDPSTSLMWTGWVGSAQTLTELGDVVIDSPSLDNILIYSSGGEWINTSYTLDRISDVDASTPNVNDVISWDGSNWSSSEQTGVIDLTQSFVDAEYNQVNGNSVYPLGFSVLKAGADGVSWDRNGLVTTYKLPTIISQTLDDGETCYYRKEEALSLSPYDSFLSSSNGLPRTDKWFMAQQDVNVTITVDELNGNLKFEKITNDSASSARAIVRGKWSIINTVAWQIEFRIDDLFYNDSGTGKEFYFGFSDASVQDDDPANRPTWDYYLYDWAPYIQMANSNNWGTTGQGGVVITGQVLDHIESPVLFRLTGTGTGVTQLSYKVEGTHDDFVNLGTSSTSLQAISELNFRMDCRFSAAESFIGSYIWVDYVKFNYGNVRMEADNNIIDGSSDVAWTEWTTDSSNPFDQDLNTTDNVEFVDLSYTGTFYKGETALTPIVASDTEPTDTTVFWIDTSS